MTVYIIWYKTITAANENVTAMWGIYTTKEKAQNELKRVKNDFWHYDSWIDEEIVQ